jgi:hypothetical protein
MLPIKEDWRGREDILVAGTLILPYLELIGH